MKLLKFSAIAFVILLALTGARCGGSTKTVGAEITDAGVSTGIKYTNEPELISETIPASSRAIFFSAQISHPTKSTEVKIAWFKLPNQAVATETFSGKRSSSSNNLDFDYKQSVSWLASQVDRPELSWKIGEYRVEAYLNGKMAKTVFFNVVSDSDAEKFNAAKIVQAVSFGDAIDDNNQLINPTASFKRDTATLYIQIKLGSAPADTKLEVGVRHVKSGLLVNTFSSVTAGNDTMLFSLSRDRFGRLWSDKLWPTGGFEVTTKINGVVGKTSTFLIQN